MGWRGGCGWVALRTKKGEVGIRVKGFLVDGAGSFIPLRSIQDDPLLNLQRGSTFLRTWLHARRTARSRPRKSGDLRHGSAPGAPTGDECCAAHLRPRPPSSLRFGSCEPRQVGTGVATQLPARRRAAPRSYERSHDARFEWPRSCERSYGWGQRWGLAPQTRSCERGYWASDRAHAGCLTLEGVGTSLRGS
jgi:hypothetical protein